MDAATATATKSLIEELSRAAQEIQDATHRLSKDFEKMPEIETSEGPIEVPDPVKLIRRICALERAVSLLTNECKEIAEDRSRIAPLVMQLQLENIALVGELAQSFPSALQQENNPQYSEGDGEDKGLSEVEEWSILSEKLEEQAKIFIPPSEPKKAPTMAK